MFFLRSSKLQSVACFTYFPDCRIFCVVWVLRANCPTEFGGRTFSQEYWRLADKITSENIYGGVLHENNNGYVSTMNYILSNGTSKSTQNI